MQTKWTNRELLFDNRRTYFALPPNETTDNRNIFNSLLIWKWLKRPENLLGPCKKKKKKRRSKRKTSIKCIDKFSASLLFHFDRYFRHCLLKTHPSKAKIKRKRFARSQIAEKKAKREKYNRKTKRRMNEKCAGEIEFKSKPHNDRRPSEHDDKESEGEWSEVMFGLTVKSHCPNAISARSKCVSHNHKCNRIEVRRRATRRGAKSSKVILVHRTPSQSHRMCNSNRTQTHADDRTRILASVSVQNANERASAHETLLRKRRQEDARNEAKNWSEITRPV